MPLEEAKDELLPSFCQMKYGKETIKATIKMYDKTMLRGFMFLMLKVIICQVKLGFSRL